MKEEKNVWRLEIKNRKKDRKVEKEKGGDVKKNWKIAMARKKEEKEKIGNKRRRWKNQK